MSGMNPFLSRVRPSPQLSAWPSHAPVSTPPFNPNAPASPTMGGQPSPFGGMDPSMLGGLLPMLMKQGGMGAMGGSLLPMLLQNGGGILGALLK